MTELKFGSYRPTEQIGAGRDGVSFRARDEAGRDVLLLHLLHARFDADRHAAIALNLRCLTLVDHDAVVQPLAVDLECAAPHIVFPLVTQSLSVAKHTADDRALIEELAEALKAIHRVGMHHRHLTPAAVGLDAGHPRLELSGAECGQAAPGEVDGFGPPANEPPGPASDVFALGALITWLGLAKPAGMLAGATIDDSQVGTALEGDFDALVRDLSDPDPAVRPSAAAVCALLSGASTHDSADEETMDSMPAPPPSSRGPSYSISKPTPAAPGPHPEVLGRYKIEGRLGAGAMGQVYRARDKTSGDVVALKTLPEHLRVKPRKLQRFRKEARLLSELSNPYIARFIELNEDDGVLFLAMELVEGEDLRQRLDAHGPFDEREALGWMCDVARGLLDCHTNGIIHRDVKPDNIVLCDGAGPASARLVDFGIARHIDDEQGSLAVTRDGGVIGTPLYMAPEQGTGGAVDARSDVYSMGCTLFHLLSGRPVFSGGGAQGVIAKHLKDPPPALKSVAPDVSDDVSHLVDRCLRKDPSDRYRDAGELLSEMLRAQNGAPEARIALHPLTPKTSPKTITYKFSWELESPPEALWPYVSDTDRLNRAVGLSSVIVEHRKHDGDVQQWGRMTVAGVDIEWQEHPFEWIENRRFGVLRTYTKGPFAFFRSVVDLVRTEGGGTQLNQRIDVEPTGMVGRAAALLEVQVKGKRGLERVYKRIDGLLARGSRAEEGMPLDVFGEVAAVPETTEARLQRVEAELVERGMDAAVTERIGRFLRDAPTPDVSHIRPAALAHRFGFQAAPVVQTLLEAVRLGAVTMHWDLICPTCRIAADIKDTLRAVQSHGHCDACDIDFELDLARSVELVFRVHPQIREPDVATYCASSPGHSPHIAARVRLAPGERFALELNLDEGRYRLAGRGLPYAMRFVVKAQAPMSRWDISLLAGLPEGLPRALRTGAQLVVLHNDCGAERVVRIERTDIAQGAFTAARASSFAPFRRLFPGEVLAHDQLVGVSHAALLIVDIADVDRLYDSLDEERLYPLLTGVLSAIDAHVGSAGGAVVKLRGDGALAVFDDAASATRAALELGAAIRAIDTGGVSLQVRAAVHAGPARMITLGDRLDYFGQTVRVVEHLAAAAPAGDVLLSQAVATDPAVSKMMLEKKQRAEVETFEKAGVGLRCHLSE